MKIRKGERRREGKEGEIGGRERREVVRAVRGEVSKRAKRRGSYEFEHMSLYNLYDSTASHW